MIRAFLCVATLHSACDRKPPPAFKPLTPPSTPVSPCGPTSTAQPHPLSEQNPPPRANVANPTPVPHPVHLQPPVKASAGSPAQQALPAHSHSPPFAVPHAPPNQDANSFTPEHRRASHAFHLWSSRMIPLIHRVNHIVFAFRSAGSSGRCQSHVYLFPIQRAKGTPSSCLRLPAAATAAAATTAYHVTVGHHTTGRCPSHW